MEFPPSHLSSSPCLQVQEQVSWALLCFSFSPPRKDSGAEGLVWWERRDKLWPTSCGSGIISILWCGRSRGCDMEGKRAPLMWIVTWLKSVQKHKISLCWNWEDREVGERDGVCWWGVKKGRSQWTSVEHSRYPLGILWSLYPKTALRRYLYSTFSNEKDDAHREELARLTQLPREHRSGLAQLWALLV